MFRPLINFQYSPCALTQGYVNDCTPGQGGANTIHFIEKDAIETITVVAGVVTAITKATGKRFWKYVPTRGSAYGKSTVTSSVENGSLFYAQEIGMALNRRQTNTRNELHNLAINTVLAVVTDSNGRSELYGYQNGLNVSGGEGGTGQAAGDRNGYTVTLTGEEPEDALEVNSTVFADLETPGT